MIGAALSATELVVMPEGPKTGPIAFPATQRPSSDPNVFDDYEEFTWSPTIGASTSYSGQVYNNQHGYGVQWGKFVSCTGGWTLSNAGTLTGDIILDGLPYTPQSGGGGGQKEAAALCADFDMATNWVFIAGIVDGDLGYVRIRGRDAAAMQAGTLDSSDIGNTNAIGFIYDAGD